MTEKTIIYKTPCVWLWVSLILFSGICGGITGLYTGVHVAEQTQQTKVEVKTNQILDKVASKLDSSKLEPKRVDCVRPPAAPAPADKPSWFHWWNGSNKH
jgi:hypothetical protein